MKLTHDQRMKIEFYTSLIILAIFFLLGLMNGQIIDTFKQEGLVIGTAIVVIIFARFINYRFIEKKKLLFLKFVFEICTILMVFLTSFAQIQYGNWVALLIVFGATIVLESTYIKVDIV